MTLLYLLIALIGAAGLYVAVAYNGLVKRRNLVQEGWSGIDVQLKRRANLIPNLVETVKGYAGHERQLLEDVTAMRSRSLAPHDVAEQGSVEGLLGAALGRLFAVAEAYPELKADANFRKLHQHISEIEDQIQLSRRYYNGAVRDLNVMVESFPSNLVAQSFQFRQADYFEIEEGRDRAVPKVSLGQA